MTTPYTADELTHPALSRSVDPDGAIRYALTGVFDHEAAVVLARRIRRDLLAARGAVRGEHRTQFVLDCAACVELTPRALDSLRWTTKLVMEELGSVVFENVGEDLAELLTAGKFSNVFTIKRAGVVKPALPEVPV